jgi:hypothetical protein
MRQIATDLFAPLDDRIFAETGVRAVDLLTMCRRIAEQVHERIAEHVRGTDPVLKARSIASLCDAFVAAAPGDSQEARALELVLTALNPNIALEDARENLLHWFHFRAPDIYTFSLDEFIAAYPNPIDREALLDVLQGWSLGFGDLAEHNAEHFFLDNPVWTQPLIRLEDDRFFCPIPDLFQSFGLQMVEAFIRDHQELWRVYGQRRGRYLEEETARLFAEALPSATVFRGSTWRDPEQSADEYENDLLVRLDAFLIVVEAKAGRMSDRARRGDVSALRQEITKLLVRPSEQSARFAEYLIRHPQVHRFATRHGTENVVDTRGVRHVVRINVTLDPLGSFSARWPALVEAGLLAHQELPPTIALADLQCIFDLLDGECQKLHYLVRRAEFEKHATYDGDEIDLLALYVQTGFNIGEVEFSENLLSISDMHETLEAFFMAQERGVAPRRPKFAMTRWWRDLVAMLEAGKAPTWTLTGLRLLDVPHQDQFKFEKRFKGHQQIVRVARKNHVHQDMVWGTFGSPQQRRTIAGLAYRRSKWSELREKVRRAAEIALDGSGSDEAVVIAVDVDKGLPPASHVVHVAMNESVAQESVPLSELDND